MSSCWIEITSSAPLGSCSLRRKLANDLFLWNCKLIWGTHPWNIHTNPIIDEAKNIFNCLACWIPHTRWQARQKGDGMLFWGLWLPVRKKGCSPSYAEDTVHNAHGLVEPKVRLRGDVFAADNEAKGIGYLLKHVFGQIYAANGGWAAHAWQAVCQNPCSHFEAIDYLHCSSVQSLHPLSFQCYVTLDPKSPWAIFYKCVLSWNLGLLTIQGSALLGVTISNCQTAWHRYPSKRYLVPSTTLYI